MAADDEIARRVNGERLLLLGWSRAILLQIAHPLVAAGVDEHSSFRQHPWSSATRLHHTVRAMLALTFGSDAARERSLEGIRTIHRRVHGTLRQPAGGFAAGTAYSAEDPALVLWVHATLLESLPLAYDLLIAPLSEADRDRYCADAASVAVALGAQPAHVPRTWKAAQAHLAAGYASGTIEVSGQARALARAVLRPPLATLVFPAAWINRVVTVGLLPAEIRDQYGFSWTPADGRAFARLVPLLRRARRIASDQIALWPEARA